MCKVRVRGVGGGSWQRDEGEVGCVAVGGVGKEGLRGQVDR